MRGAFSCKMQTPKSLKKGDFQHSPITVLSTKFYLSEMKTRQNRTTILGKRVPFTDEPLLHQSTLQELRSRIHSSNRLRRQLKGWGKKSMGKKINVKVVKAIPISSLIYGLLKWQRAFLSATVYFYSNRLTANGTEAII